MDIIRQTLGLSPPTPTNLTDYISVALKTSTGHNAKAIVNNGIASFYANKPEKIYSLKVGINTQQAGSGDPSPTNVRPLSGWTGMNLVVSPTTDAQDGSVYTVSWQSEADTVYGGTLDVTTGLLTVDAVKNIFAWGNGIGSTNLGSVTRKLFTLSAPSVDRVQGKNSCSMAPFLYNYLTDSVHFYCNGTHALVFLPTDTPAATEFEVVANLAAPVTYQIDPTEIIAEIGENNVWADTGSVLELIY